MTLLEITRRSSSIRLQRRHGPQTRWRQELRRLLRPTAVFLLMSSLFVWLTPWIGCCGLQHTKTLSLTQLHPRASRLFGHQAPRVLSLASPPTNADHDWVQKFPNKVVRSLDLYPLMKRVAAHAATRRGKEALLAVVEIDESEQRLSHGGGRTQSFASSMSPRRRTWLSSSVILDSTVDPTALTTQLSPNYKSRLLTSLQEVRDEYDRVEQATLVLQGWNNLSFPSLYGGNGDDGTTGGFETSPWSADFEVNSDDDEWLRYLTTEDFTLENILQAQQVVQMLLTVFDWASQENVVQWCPSLACLGRRMDRDALVGTLNAIEGAVEIVRVRSVTDPNARSTFQFQLNETKYHALRRLSERARTLDGKSNVKARSSNHVADVLEEIRVITGEIQQSLSLSILKCRQIIHQGLNLVAELDVIYSKAAFGLAVKGQLPSVQDEGCIHVEQFIHPLLVDESFSSVVPIDLRMCKERRVLTISGMNGGGKTVALKSFGVVACLVRLGIPMPSLSNNKVPRVAYFDRIVTAVGDDQDMTRGESTFTSQLNAYSTILDTVSKSPEHSYLILMDELGAGTEVNAGGAIAQAILERLLQTPACRSVITTHSARLKTLSFESKDFECAAVLRSTPTDDGTYRKPTFQLQYGVIGESYAIGAVARCAPPFPSEVLDRAVQLASEFQQGDDKATSATHLDALKRSLDKQVQLAEQSRVRAQTDEEGAAKCRQAMQSLARAYDRHLTYLLNRIEDNHQKLKVDSDDSLYIVGETLRELQVMRKEVKSQIDFLSDQGLKILPHSYELSEGECVVVVDDGIWNGLTGHVKLSANSLSSDIATDEVVVEMSLNPLEEWHQMEVTSTSSESDRTVVFKRYQLAIWDYDSVWDTSPDSAVSSSTSIQESRRRLAEVLKSIPSSSSTTAQGIANSGRSSVYKSSRERKASKSRRKKR